MNNLKESLLRVKKRPIVLAFLVIVVLVFCIIEQFNPITKKFGSLKTLISLDYMENLAEFAQDIKISAATPGIMVTNVVIALLLIVASSCLFSVFFAGYAQVLYMSVLDFKPRKGDFKNGINRHFAKMSVLFTVFVLFTIIFIVLAAYTVVPAVMTIKIFFAGDSGVIFQMMLLSVLTIMILYFAIVFYVMYWSFSVPAIIGFKRGGVIVAMRMVNGYCWYLMPRITMFLLFVLLINTGMLALNYGKGSMLLTILVLLLNWALKLAIVFPYINFVFTTFIDMKEDMFPSNQ